MLRTLAAAVAFHFAMGGHFPHSGEAGYQINNPSEGGQYVQGATIGTAGETIMGVDVVVKLNLGGVTQTEQAIDVPGQSFEWSHNFSPPSGGWTVSDNWACVLMAGGVQRDSHSYKVVTM
jgi:hypothetical protein